MKKPRYVVTVKGDLVQNPKGVVVQKVTLSQEIAQLNARVRSESWGDRDVRVYEVRELLRLRRRR
jgi:hypothetical protein